MPALLLLCFALHPGGRSSVSRSATMPHKHRFLFFFCFKTKIGDGGNRCNMGMVAGDESGSGGRHLEEAYTCAVVDGALRRTTFELAEADAESLSKAPNYWVPRRALRGEDGDGPLRGCGERASADLLERVAEDLLDGDVAETFEGCEYWCQVYNGGRGLRFHFDKDEHMLRTEGKYEFPILSTVVYLTAATGGGARQSPTIVVDQVYRGDSPEEEEEAPRKTVLSYPKQNRALAFDGRLAHGVLDSTNASCRRTLLVNFWKEKPRGLDRATVADLEALGMARTGEAPAGEKGETGKAERRDPVRRELGGGDDLVLLDDVAASVPDEELREASCVSVSHPKHALYPIEAASGMQGTLGAFVREE